jgi:hypothetical protein
MRRLFVLVALLATIGVTATNGFAFGPVAQPQALDACNATVDAQVAAGIQAGGGPKSVDVGPANCDHFWQRPAREDPIGNGWPPPPYQP